MWTRTALGLLLLLSLPACGSPLPGDDPREVVLAFQRAYREEDFELALDLLTAPRGGYSSEAEAIAALKGDRWLVEGGVAGEILGWGTQGEGSWVEVRIAGGHIRMYNLAREAEGWRIFWWLDGMSPAWTEPKVRLPKTLMSVLYRLHQSPELTVSLTAGGDTLVKGKEYEREARPELLEVWAFGNREAEPAYLHLRIDRSVPWSEVARLLEEAARAGLFAISAGAAPEDGGDGPTSTMTEGTLFRSLERRLPCFLPLAPVAPEEIGLVIDVGAVGFDEATADAAATALKGRWPEPFLVLINARPDAPWQDVVRAMDLGWRLGAQGRLLARPGDEPPEKGVRLNGLTIEELPAAGAPPRFPDHPALSRIIQLGR